MHLHQVWLRDQWHACEHKECIKIENQTVSTWTLSRLVVHIDFRGSSVRDARLD
jgi:hypothetical protein